jgi:hypothetical protein
MKNLLAVFGAFALALLAACALLDPVPDAPPRVDDPVTVPLSDGSTVALTPASVEPRETTKGDVLAGTLGTAAVMLGGNPLLWGLGQQLAHLGLGIFQRRKKAAAPV